MWGRLFVVLALLSSLTMELVTSSYVCQPCGKNFRSEKGLSVHTAMWCKPPSTPLLKCHCGFECAEPGVLIHHRENTCYVNSSTIPDGDIRAKYLETQRKALDSPQAEVITRGMWMELWIAWFVRRTGLSEDKAQEMIQFIQFAASTEEEEAGSLGSTPRTTTKLARYRTILDRIKKDRVYPTGNIGDAMKLLHVFTGVPEKFGGDSNRKVMFRYGDTIAALISTLHDPKVVGSCADPYVTQFQKRYDGALCLYVGTICYYLL